jgi:AcrR family transcriptional regulator
LDLLSTSNVALPSRNERRRQATADRIVDAAAALFGERGMSATTVAAICERADVAHQTFFNHFPTKADVVREIVRRGDAFLEEKAEAALEQGPGTAERLAWLFSEIHSAASAVGPMHQDLVSESIRVANDMTDPARALHLAFARILRKGRSQGDVTRRHALDDLVGLAIGALSQLMFAWSHDPAFPMAERSARMARLLADALAPR